MTFLAASAVIYGALIIGCARSDQQVDKRLEERRRRREEAAQEHRMLEDMKRGLLKEGELEKWA